MKYRRSHAIEMGRRLDPQDQMKALHRDMGGPAQQGGPPESEPPPGMSQWTGPSPMLSRPFGNYMNFPPMGGGYSHPMTYQQMMGGQQTPQNYSTLGSGYTTGGSVDESALAQAHRLLYEAKRACGGQVGGSVWDTIAERADGGEVRIDEPAHVSEAKRLLASWDKIDRDNPRVSADRRFSYVCNRAPGIARFLKTLLQDGWSRSGARAQIRGALVRWAEEE
jgi:hypothetical protein